MSESNLPFTRRAARRLLRPLRPLALPFLNRLQLRMAHAVEHSGILLRMEAEARDRADAARLDMEALMQRVAVAQLGIDAIRLDMQQFAEVTTGAIDAIRQQHEAIRQQQEQALRATGELTTIAARLVQRVAVPLGTEVMVWSPEGYLLLPAEDDRLVAYMIDSRGRLEPGTIAVIQALIRPGDTVIDVGAHLGLTVLPAARAAGPEGRVIAVEPGSRVAGLLRRNIALNALDEVVVVHGCAAGAGPGEARLSIRPVLGESSLISPATEGPAEEVLVRPLDALVPPGTRIRLVKIDVEGYELEVWRGMTRIVADNPDLALLLEFGPSHLQRAGITPAEWMASFAQAGFTAYEIEETTGTVRQARPPDALQQVPSINLLMLRAPLSEYPALRPA